MVTRITPFLLGDHKQYLDYIKGTQPSTRKHLCGDHSPFDPTTIVIALMAHWE